MSLGLSRGKGSQSAGSTVPVVAREAFGCLFQEGTFLARVQHIVHQHAQVPLCIVLFQTAPGFAGASVIPSQGQDMAFPFTIFMASLLFSV